MTRLALLTLVLGSLAAAPACSKGGKADKASAETPAPEAARAQAPAPPPPAAAAEMPEVGDPAPEFATVAHDGTEISTESLKGEPWVLYFYPRDETPG